MKSNIETELVETRKRIRKICEWFAALNKEISESELPHQGLPESVVTRIHDQNFRPDDLMAIRNTPFAWTMTNPYDWLWILHRYQNDYRKAVAS